MRANQWNNRYQVGQRVLVRDDDNGPWIRAETVTPAREGPQAERCFIDVQTGARRLTIPLREERIKPEQPVGRYEAITEVPLDEVPLPEPPGVLEKFARVFRGPRPAGERRYDDGTLEYDFTQAGIFRRADKVPDHILSLPVRVIVDELSEYNADRATLTFGRESETAQCAVVVLRGDNVGQYLDALDEVDDQIEDQQP